MTRQIVKSEGSVIVYDDSKISHIGAALFEPDYWPKAERTKGKAGGRGAALFINIDGLDCVLRHYYRGGLPSKLLGDRLGWVGSTRTRSFREWDLLQEMHALNLPVPAPIAARYVHHGFYYTADLITARLPNVRTLSGVLIAGSAPDLWWRNIGECIARFHFAGFYHADLNAHNLQVDDAGRILLLDWDRGERRSPGSWRNSNLARLHRSLKKIQVTHGADFAQSDWEILHEAYLALWQRLPD